MSVIVSDDLASFRKVTEKLGLKHQICQFHVRRWAESPGPYGVGLQILAGYVGGTPVERLGIELLKLMIDHCAAGLSFSAFRQPLMLQTRIQQMLEIDSLFCYTHIKIIRV